MIQNTLDKNVLSEYQDQFLSPYLAADLGYVDAVIYPRETRQVLSKAFVLYRTTKETAIQIKSTVTFHSKPFEPFDLTKGEHRDKLHGLIIYYLF